MNYLRAVNDKHLGLCLRMLFAENLKINFVETVMNGKNKIEFHIGIDADESTVNKLKERYEILIS